MMSQEIAISIRAARQRKGLTQKEAALRAELPYRTYWAYEKGEIGSPSLENVRAIANALDAPELLEGLSPGQGDGDDATGSALSTVSPSSPSPSRDAEAYVEVPIYGGASAGPGLTPPGEVHRYERLTRREFQRIFGRPAPDGDVTRVGFWEVIGDSAAPVYFEHELVPVEVVGPTQAFNNDGLYVFRWDGSVMLKRLRRQPDGSIRAVSLNPSIDPFVFRPNGDYEFAVLGRVIQPEKQQLYAALVGRAFAIQQQVWDVIKGSKG